MNKLLGQFDQIWAVGAALAAVTVAAWYGIRIHLRSHRLAAERGFDLGTSKYKVLAPLLVLWATATAVLLYCLWLLLFG